MMQARIRDSILRDFALLPRCFSTQELTEDADSAKDSSALIRAMQRDERFILLGAGQEELLIAERALFLWYTRLLTKLSRAGIYRLTTTQFAGALSALRVRGQWNVPPMESINYGSNFGLVTHAPRGEDLVFPLARLLHILTSSGKHLTISILEELGEKEHRDTALTCPIEYWTAEGFSYFDERTTFLIERRAGLLGNPALTLEELGCRLILTRERIRQIEVRFWSRVSLRSSVQAPFMKALLCEVIRNKGNLVFNSDSRTIKFLAKCVGIPYAVIPSTELAILGMSRDATSFFAELAQPASRLTVEDVVMQRLGQEVPCLSLAAAQTISRSIVSFNRKHLTKAQRVYLALQSIGKPAHYSDVTDAYNRLFPDRPSTERNIHAILSREESGIVWIGIRGTFAIKEWGYEHPSKTLFNTIQEIVERIYGQTGKAVPLNLINAEIGKYRRVVRPSSVIIASHLNPGLRHVEGNSFVPKYAHSGQTQDLTADDLDRILDEFQPQSLEEGTRTHV